MTVSPISDKSSSPASSRRTTSAKSGDASAKPTSAADGIPAVPLESGPPADVNVSMPIINKSEPMIRPGPPALVVWPD